MVGTKTCANNYNYIRGVESVGPGGGGGGGGGPTGPPYLNGGGGQAPQYVFIIFFWSVCLCV